MNICNETEQLRHVLAIGIWEDESGAPGRDSPDLQYGRSIEADRSWTVYHVFTGVPAYSGGQTMTGLSRPHATDRMLSLNRPIGAASRHASGLHNLQQRTVHRDPGISQPEP